MQFTKNY